MSIESLCLTFIQPIVIILGNLLTPIVIVVNCLTMKFAFPILISRPIPIITVVRDRAMQLTLSKVTDTQVVAIQLYGSAFLDPVSVYFALVAVSTELIPWFEIVHWTFIVLRRGRKLPFKVILKCRQKTRFFHQSHCCQFFL